MSSPAERYAAARKQRRSSQTHEFAAGYEFPLDDFQIRACQAVEEGRGVLVAAPTGAGKTIVGEFAVHLALTQGKKAFYTTPIKALSNQKYTDLCRRHGNDKVGLLTGDSVINGHAPIVVMTTEVLRNMLYVESPDLAGLGYVVMDEVHYLADRFRGAVWEEVIIHLPDHVSVISLSATVSNAEEFGAWLGEVRGDTEIVVEEFRPVPLWQHMMVGHTVHDLFAETDDPRTPTHRHHHGPPQTLTINPDLLDAIIGQRRSTDRRGRLEDIGGPRGRRGKIRRRPGHPRTNHSTPAETHPRPPGRPHSRATVIDSLDRAGLLPAITFIFSRAGCDAAVQQLLQAGTNLIPEDQARHIHRTVEERVASLAPDDLTVLGYRDFLAGLTRGFAAHHAGMLPTFREIVEELFTAGLIRAVFATETLALGINMPARSVILEKLVKYNGEAHVGITPAEYTQLTGRAGRRGVDIEGHAVVLWNPQIDPDAVGGLASTRTYPLRSSFRPNPNMAVNLVATFGRDRARNVLETSFAQYQADRSVVGMNRTIHQHQEALDGYAESMTCHLGDFTEYAALRRQISDVEKDAVRARHTAHRALIAQSLEGLRPGDVLHLTEGRHSGRAVVLSGSNPRGSDPLVTVLTEDARAIRIGPRELSCPARAVAKVKIPKGFHARVVKDRKDLAATVRAQVPVDGPPPEADMSVTHSAQATERRVDDLRAQLRRHPCHGCPDREHHARWAERWWRLERETAALRRKVAGRTNSIARTFDRLCDILTELGYLTDGGTTVTSAGERLRRIYNERDLLVAECLRHDLWLTLSPAELAAMVSTLVHEPRREENNPFPTMPTAAVGEAYDAMLDLWSGLDDRLTARGLPTTAPPDAGLSAIMHRWATGSRLESVLDGSDLAPGDFVRRCKQVVDLLDQIAQAAPRPELAESARRAGSSVLRGVVAADRLD
ncbi:ATP-dependent RNA helicase HelY [Austwickia chelonae]|uniref:Putative helicase n=1 Tax=Austwickia chelonae NBRC 105200 TaxID=1184607 RepID=K6VP66_9MICO|nr:DEAD/DEAH box helicase [Austwickia chelonae]GAB77165.1 putative helicase [Austwickia chelonae NBRC 105200]SEW04259.1 ATP-dependent RNA helicase HelY [Austwickia chelonae]